MSGVLDKFNPEYSDAIKSEISSRKKQIYQLQMERDLLEKAAEIFKKGQGINLRELANKGTAHWLMPYEKCTLSMSCLRFWRYQKAVITTKRQR